MKQTIILSIFMVLASLFAFGQRTELKNKRNLKKHRVEKHFKKSNRNHNNIRQGHLFIKNRNISKDSNFKTSVLDDKQELDSLIVQNWDKSTNQWVDEWKDEFSYNSNDNLILEYGYEWNTATNIWEVYDKYEFTYDSNNNLIIEISYELIPNTSNWVHTWKDEYTYDSNGNRTQYLEYNEAWNNFRKYEYTYNTSGNMTQELMYSWTQDLFSKIEYTYDSSGNMVQYLYYEWNSSQWIVLWKGEFTYEANGDIIESLGYYWDSSKWVTSTKNEYTYDSNGNIIQYLYAEWESNLWFVYWKGEFTYDTSFSFSDLVLPNYFSDYIYLILPDYYSDYEYIVFLNDMLTNTIDFEWDAATNNLENSSNTVFYYSKQNSLSVSDVNKSEFNIYPNPAVDNFTIDSKLPLIKVEIYSILGQIVKEVNTNLKSIYLGDLSNGIYMIKIYSEKGTIVRKLIKK